jgi:hypothetical protein
MIARAFARAESLFDRLHRIWKQDRTRRATTDLLIVVFLGTVVAVEAGRRGWLPAAVTEALPRTHFAAVSLAFTFFLVFEIVELVFALSESVARAAGKQFEIFSLILLREAFKEFSNFGEPIQWEQVRQPVLHIVSDAVGALLIFVTLAFYLRAQRHQRITVDAEDQSSFVQAKKGIALLLLATFAGIGIHDLTLLVQGQETYPFFETFYTVLIFTDVLIVLISLRYTSTYHVVFRNSGFALATVALRLALAAPPYVNAAIGLGATVFALGLTMAYNAYGSVPAPEDVRPPLDAATPDAAEAAAGSESADTKPADSSDAPPGDAPSGEAARSPQPPSAEEAPPDA